MRAQLWATETNAYGQHWYIVLCENSTLYTRTDTISLLLDEQLAVEFVKPSPEWGPGAGTGQGAERARFLEKRQREEESGKHVFQDELFLVRGLCSLTNLRHRGDRQGLFAAKEADVISECRENTSF